MTLLKPTLLLTGRALRQFPRLPAVLVFSMVPPLVQFLLFGSIFGNLPDLPTWNQPTDNYYEFLAPAVVFFTTILGIANAGVALVQDFQNRYFLKILLAPVSMWSILLGRLLSDGVRVYLQASVILILALFFGGSVSTGVPGALLILALGTLFSIFTVGALVVNVAIKTRDAQAVQAIFPVFFILIFLTSAFLPKENVSSEAVRHLISGNPAEYIVRPMRELMLDPTYHWDHLGLAFAIIGAFALVGVALTMINFRNVYK